MNERVYKKIDLHLHTTSSDGTDTMEELLDIVREKGFDLFSVTDHDAVKGGILMPDLLRKGDPAFIRGIEFSCRDSGGKYHILGYGYDPELAGIRTVVSKGHKLRMEKTAARIRYLEKEYGMEFDEEEVREVLSQDNPGKPHIARMMIRHGYAPTISEAINKYINGKKFPDLFLPPEVAVQAILKGGGIPVLAHPAYGSGDELILGEELDARVRKLMGYGLQGLEGFYSGYSDKIRNEILSLAEKYDLYVTAGSDYHGSNKLVMIGDTELDDAADGPEGLQRFLRDVRIISK